MQEAGSGSDIGKSAGIVAGLEGSTGKKRVRCKPFLKWAGGKTSLLPELIKRVPWKFSRYFEPMVGAGALFFKLQPEKARLGDVNAELVNVYQVVRAKCDELIEDLSRHRHEKEYFLELRNADRQENYKYWSDVQRASRFIYLNKTCFNGLYRVNSKGQFNVPFGDYKNPNFLDEKNLRACSQVLAAARLAQADFEEIVESAEEGDFVYFDPPYVPLSESSSFTSYSKEGFGLQEQERLASCFSSLSERGVQCMLSNSDTSIVRELYGGFRIEQVFAPRAINSKATKRGAIAELIIRNY